MEDDLLMVFDKFGIPQDIFALIYDRIIKIEHENRVEEKRLINIILLDKLRNTWNFEIKIYGVSENLRITLLDYFANAILNIQQGMVRHSQLQVVYVNLQIIPNCKHVFAWLTGDPVRYYLPIEFSRPRAFRRV